MGQVVPSDVTATPKAVWRSPRGVWPLASLAAAPRGVAVTGQASGGGGKRKRGSDSPANPVAYVLTTTPELFGQTLARKTQILFYPDISYIVASLAAAPGCAVFEAGTGSGVLTAALAAAVAPGGRVLTADFHAGRAAAARSALAPLGLVAPAGPVESVVGDVCATAAAGTNPLYTGGKEGWADGVFLDIPTPWAALHGAAYALRYNGTLVLFSPAIEQVQKTYAGLAHASHLWGAPPRTVELISQPYAIPRRPRPGPAAAATTAAAAAGGGAWAADLAGESPAALTQPEVTARGHTGYLTVVRRAPGPAAPAAAAAAAAPAAAAAAGGSG